MNESIKLFAKISAKSTARWFVNVFIGLIIFIVGFFIGLALLNNNSGAGYAGARAGGIGAVIGLFLLFIEEFFTALLLFGSFVLLFLYVANANKSALQTALYELWKNKGNSFLMPRITALLQKIQSIKGINDTANVVILKTNLLKQNSLDKSVSRLQRKITSYGLSKIHLDEIEITNAEQLPGLITAKIEDKISTASKPSFKPLLYLVFIHVMLMVLAIIFDHQ